MDAYDLYYASDPSSQIVCTIGANVAENSGDVHCLKYGLTAHNIQQADVIATANVGCQLHLANRSSLLVRHWLELLDEVFVQLL